MAFMMFWQEAAHGAASAEHASGGSEHHVSWVAEQVNHLVGHEVPEHLVMVGVSVLICTVGIWLFRGNLSVDNPSYRQQILEGFVLQVRGMIDQTIGHYGRKYLPVVGAFAMFILLSNLMGLIPIFKAPTVSLNVTLALGLTSFCYYMGMGFKQQGLGYLKHFMGGLTSGPMVIFGMLLFFIELLSNCLRPATLGVRLFINIFADEQLAEAISANVIAWGLPSVLMFLATFVAFVQTFVFVTLSVVYLGETVPHDDHHGDHDHGAAH
jgi:F-type H+-transporting ATPase subunit a